MSIDDYIEQHTSDQGQLLKDLERRAHIELMRPRMISGHVQGRLLKILCSIKEPKRVLEIGTYTGYAALCLAEALGEDAFIHTLECDDEMESFIHRFVDQSPYKDKIVLHMGNALDILPSLVKQESFDLVYMDANKREYSEYFDIIIDYLPKGAVILADNTLWDGKVALDPMPHDSQTIAIDQFNKKIRQDRRVEEVILPLRDGLSIIRKI